MITSTTALIPIFITIQQKAEQFKRRRGWGEPSRRAGPSVMAVSCPQSARWVSTPAVLYRVIALRMKRIHKEIDKDGRGWVWGWWWGGNEGGGGVIAVSDGARSSHATTRATAAGAPGSSLGERHAGERVSGGTRPLDVYTLMEKDFLFASLIF